MESLTESVSRLAVTDGGHDTTILINYAAFKNASVKRISNHQLESLKLKDTDVQILLVGEGNFTFTVALSAIRESWSGIVSTRYEAESVDNPRPIFTKVQEECIKFCRKNGELLRSDDATIRSHIEAIEKVQPPPEENWLFGIDATKTPDSLIVRGKVVLFQCPWLAKSDRNGTPATLITDFLQHMSTKQDKDDYVLIGITKLFPYVTNYELGDLLGDGLSGETDKSGKYNFIGADDTFIQGILKHGYHHISCHFGSGTDIHEEIIFNHITLIFQRNDRRDHPTSQ